jgi:hypothetical protein
MTTILMVIAMCIAPLAITITFETHRRMFLWLSFLVLNYRNIDPGFFQDLGQALCPLNLGRILPGFTFKREMLRGETKLTEELWPLFYIAASIVLPTITAICGASYTTITVISGSLFLLGILPVLASIVMLLWNLKRFLLAKILLRALVAWRNSNQSPGPQPPGSPTGLPGP